MEVEKRKRLTDVEVAGKKVKASSAEEDDRKSNNSPTAAEAAVPEEEVEEFFAILRRIHVAVKYFGRVNGESGGRREAAPAETVVRPWNPSFRREDFEDKAAEVETAVVENTGLDLNVEPCSPDQKPV